MAIEAPGKRYPIARTEADEEPRLVPVRMVNEVLYCERLMYLEWIQGEFADNAYTVEGRAVHRRVDRGSRPMQEAKSVSSHASEKESCPEVGEVPYVSRSVWLTSEKLGLTGKVDLVEVDGGRVVPIEYKRGKRPKGPEGAYLPERAQLCAHVLLLREHGFHCDEAAIYYAGDRRRVPIAIDQDLIEATLAATRRARALARSERIPAPLVDSPKCVGCSLAGICLPDEVNLLREMERERRAGDTESEAEAEPVSEGTTRRLHPARDDLTPLYVQEPGAYIGLRGECLRVRSRDGRETEARLVHTSQVCLLGNVQISTQALRSLLQRGIPVGLFTSGGWFVGRATGNVSKNAELRLAQFRAAVNPAFCLEAARAFVAAKILNCRTLLRRNHRSPEPVVLGAIGRIAQRALRAASLAELLGLEGLAARRYFGAFAGMLRSGDRDAGFDIAGRNRRPPRDPVNALLSFCYSLLAKELTQVLAAVGLDPLVGFYHQPRFGRAALALDLMEEFRPLIADSVVITAVNTRVVRERDFLHYAGGVTLEAPGRRRLIQAFERRMSQLVTHPIFGYRISYRRVLEVQARLLSRLLLGEIDSYPSFRTR